MAEPDKFTGWPNNETGFAAQLSHWAGKLLESDVAKNLPTMVKSNIADVLLPTHSIEGGKNKPFISSADYFTKEEQKALVGAINFALQNKKPKHGAWNSGGGSWYDEETKTGRIIGDDLTRYGDEAAQNVKYTLGDFYFKKNDDGTFQIKDTYNWDTEGYPEVIYTGEDEPTYQHPGEPSYSSSDQYFSQRDISRQSLRQPSFLDVFNLARYAGDTIKKEWWDKNNRPFLNHETIPKLFNVGEGAGAAFGSAEEENEGRTVDFTLPLNNAKGGFIQKTKDLSKGGRV